MTSMPPEALFPDFLNDPKQYRQSEEFWRQAFVEALGPQSSEWEAWFNDPLREGMPIFTRRHKGRRLGLVVQQAPPDDDPVWFKCWINDFASPEEEPFPYLVIHTIANETARRKFIVLLQLLAMRQLRVESVRTFVADVMKRDLDFVKIQKKTYQDNWLADMGGLIRSPENPLWQLGKPPAYKG